MKKQLHDGFTAMPIQNMDEITPSRGATSGLLHPSGIAKHYCEMSNFTIGDIMAYGFRRFGYPVNGWDVYKQLCQWVIRTPMEGVFLTLQPTDLSPFGFLLKDPLSQELSDEQMLPLIEWGQQCRKWAKETHGVTLMHTLHYAGRFTNEEADEEFRKWISMQGEVETDAIIKRFMKEKREECERLAAEYKQTHPSPKRSHQCHALDDNAPETPTDTEKKGTTKGVDTSGRGDGTFRVLCSFVSAPFWENLPESSLERQINEAIYRTILDLKRPVPIRDWQLDIMGKCTGEGFRVYTEDDDGYEELTQDYFAPIATFERHSARDSER